MKITNKVLSLILTISIIVSFCFVIPVLADEYPAEGIIWDFNSTDAVSAANAAVATAACGTITADTDFVNSYDVSATFTTNSTRRMQIKLPNNTIQLKDSDGKYVYNYLHILVGNPQSEALTFGCGINTTSANTQVTLPANSWTVASFYIEDLFLAGNSNYKRDGKNYADSVEGVAFQMSDQIAGANTTNAGIKYNLDKVWVTANPLPAFELMTVVPAKGYNEMSPLGASFSFEFSRDIKTIETHTLSDALVSSDGEYEDAVLKVAGNKLVVEAAQNLNFETNYTFNIGDTVIKDKYGVNYPEDLGYKFTTEKENLTAGPLKAKDSLSNEILSLSDSGSVFLSASALNPDNSAASAVIAATLTDKETGVSRLEVSSSCELPSVMAASQMLDDFKVEVPDNHYLTAVIVNNPDDCYPLSSTYLMLTDDEKTSGIVYTGGNMAENVSVSLDEPSISVDTLTISGTVSGNPDGLVIVGIKDKTNNELKFLMPTIVPDDGKFTCNYIFSDASSGKYEIFAVARGALHPALFEMVYLGDDTKEVIRSSFDGDIISESALELIKTYRDGMGIPSTYSDELLSHIANVLCEQKPYSSYQDLVVMMDTSVEALSDLNNASWSSYKDVLAEYDIILTDDDSLSDYEKYNDTAKSEVYKIAVEASPFNNFTEFRKAIVDACDEYAVKLKNQKEDNNKRPGSSLSGGGSSSGGRVSVGGSSATELQQQATEPIANTPSGMAEFSDLSSDHWAYDAVNKLAIRNIVSGYEDGSFGGERAVTRAEFVKMITATFTFPEGNGEKFSDVSSDAWYFEFLSRASAAGIVKGTDGKFMPDSAITRQDAAVLLYRSLVYKNAVSSGNKTFTDSYLISDYALSAVETMAHLGLVSGYTDGSFAPLNEITRFETARLIYNAYAYMSGGVIE